MTLTIAQAEDAWIKGNEQFEKWKAEFEGQWMAPVGELYIKMLWAQLPPEMHAQLRQMDPKSYDVMRKQIEGG